MAAERAAREVAGLAERAMVAVAMVGAARGVGATARGLGTR